MNTNTDKDVGKLNDFLQNEMAAVETYAQCIEKGQEWPIATRLTEIRQSHAERVRMLQDRITALGGKPAEGSGMWGGVAKLVQGGANAFGEKSALSALEEGEDKGLEDYREDLDDLSATTRQFVASMLLPEQQRSHNMMRSLKH